MNRIQETLYRDLMALVAEEDSSFYHVDHLLDGEHFRVFNYRLASYTDFLKPNALESRGIMFRIDSDGTPLELAALPPKKFFNNKENPLVMDVDFSKTELIMEKMDGSLMTAYRWPSTGGIRLKSKTSLTSEQANAANDFLYRNEHSDLYTFLIHMTLIEKYSVSLEYCAPQFRIVVPVQNESLTVLCARDLRTGETMPYSKLKKEMEKFNCEKYLVKNIMDEIPSDKILEFIENIPSMNDGREGFVILADGMLTKHKQNWYVSAHKAKDDINSDRKLFECVVNQAQDDIRSLFNDDPYVLGRIDMMEQKVKKIYNDYVNRAVKYVEEHKAKDVKTFAIDAQKELPKIIFGITMALYRGKQVNFEEWMISNYKEFGLSNDVDAVEEEREALTLA